MKRITSFVLLSIICASLVIGCQQVADRIAQPHPRTPATNPVDGAVDAAEVAASVHPLTATIWGAVAATITAYAGYRKGKSSGKYKSSGK